MNKHNPISDCIIQIVANELYLNPNVTDVEITEETGIHLSVVRLAIVTIQSGWRPNDPRRAPLSASPMAVAARDEIIAHLPPDLAELVRWHIGGAR